MSTFTDVLVDAHNAATDTCDHHRLALTIDDNALTSITCCSCGTAIPVRTPEEGCLRCGDWLQPGGFCPTCDAGPGSIFAREEKENADVSL